MARTSTLDTGKILADIIKIRDRVAQQYGRKDSELVAAQARLNKLKTTVAELDAETTRLAKAHEANDAAVVQLGGQAYVWPEVPEEAAPTAEDVLPEQDVKQEKTKTVKS